MTTPRYFRLLFAAAGALSGLSLSAHDMWIEPMSFSPEPGDIVGVRLRVGQDLLGDPLPRQSSLIKQFLVEDKQGRKPVIGREGANPAGFLRASAPGLLVIGYASNPSKVELPAEKFNQYLQDEGLDSIAALRARRNQTGEKVQEMFSRCAKSLVFSGPSTGAGSDRKLGFTLELVAERNPYAIPSGGEFPVRLTYEGLPLPGALVIAMNKMNPTEKQKVRTDKEGRAVFHLRPGGMWLIKAVHMIPAPSGSNADWASFWASLTFEFQSDTVARQ